MAEQNDIQNLMMKALDGDADEGELCRLAEILKSDRTALDEYVRLASVDAELRLNAAKASSAVRGHSLPIWIAAAAAVIICLLMGLLLVDTVVRENGVSPVVRATNGTADPESYDLVVLSDEIMLPVFSDDPEPIRAEGENRLIKMRDGSDILLAAGGSLRVLENGPDDRIRVRLEEGTANFKVAKAEKNFIVETDAGRVRALGTEFDVTALERPVKLKTYASDGTQFLSGRRAGMSVSVLSGAVMVEQKNMQRRIDAGNGDTFYGDSIEIVDAPRPPESVGQQTVIINRIMLNGQEVHIRFSGGSNHTFEIHRADTPAGKDRN